MNAVGAGPVREGAAKRGGLHLLGRPLRVVAGLRSVDDATTRVLRGADRALTGVTRALLLVRLLATAGDHGARLGSRGALARRGTLSDDDLVDQGDVRVDVEELGGKIGGAGLLSGCVRHVNSDRGCHVTRPSRLNG